MHDQHTNVIVKNADDQADTVAQILISNQIDYSPKVSVIIPVYNAERYLRECLDSLIQQTLQEIEIVCINDGSTDRSLDILKEYACKDKRITIICQQNINAGVARNAGLAIARGEYLSFLDADDFFASNMLESLYAYAKKQQAQVCICEADCCDMQKNGFFPMPWGLRMGYLPQSERFSGEDIKKYIFNFTVSWVWNKVFEARFIRENNIRFQSVKRTNDLYFTYLSLALASRITTLRKCLVHYRKGHGNNLQATNDQSPRDWYTALMLLKRKLTECGIFAQYEQSFVNAAVDSGLYNLQAIHDDEVRHELRDEMSAKLAHDMGIMSHINNPSYYYHKKSYQSFLTNVLCQKRKTICSILKGWLLRTRHLWSRTMPGKKHGLEHEDTATKE